MIMAIGTGNQRNAMLDAYKSITNGLHNKHEVIAVTPSVYAPEEFSDEFSLKIQENHSSKHRLSAKIRAFVFALELVFIAKRHHVTKVFFYNDKDWFNIIMFPLLRISKLPFVVWVHDPKLHSGEKIRVRVISWLVTRNYRNASELFVAYDRGKTELTSNYNIENKEITILKLPSINDLEFTDIRDSQFQKSEFEYELIFFGRIEEYKGLDILLSAMKNIWRTTNQDCKLLVVGKGQYSRIFSNAIKNLNNVTFVNDYVPNRQLASYICDAKVVVLPYRDATGTQTIQICNYYSKPVIANNVGCFPEYIATGRNGFVVDDITGEKLADTIRRILNNDALYEELKSSSYQYYLENFTHDGFNASLSARLGLLNAHP